MPEQSTIELCAACEEPVDPIDQIRDTAFGDEIFCSHECADSYGAATDPALLQDPDSTDALDGATVHEPAPLPAVVTDGADIEIGAAWTSHDEWVGMCQMATIMAGADLVPRELRRKPNDVLLLLMTGRDLNLSPSQAVNGGLLYVVEGRVTLAPKFRLALLNRSGKGTIKPAEKPTGTRVVANVFDGAGRLIEQRDYTMTEAPDELKRKNNWKNYPARMLWWRLVGFLLDDHWPEIGMGLYSPDELGAVTDEDGVPIDPSTVAMPSGFEQVTATREPAPPDPLEQHRRALASKVVEISTTSERAKALLRDRWATAGLPKTRDIADMDTLIVADEICETVKAELAAAAKHDERPFTDDTPDVEFDNGHDIPEAEVIYESDPT
jgi:hypothetical protein